MAKESLYPVQGSGVVFRDAFNTQTDTEHINNATVTGVDFSGGLATFGAGDSIVYGPVVPGVKSVRIKGVFSSLTTTLLTLSASHSVSVAAGTISATGFSSPTIYVDGAVSSTLTAGAHEIIVTTATAIEANTLEISSFEGDYDLLGLFRITLTAIEVSLLAQNRLYQGLIKQGLVVYYDFTRGSSFDYSNNGNDGVDTNIVYKHGLGAEFNGDDAFITMPAGTNRVAFSQVFAFYSYGSTGDYQCLSGGDSAWYVDIQTNHKLRVFFGTTYQIPTAITFGRHYVLSIVYEDGDLRQYIDADLVKQDSPSGTIDLSIRLLGKAIDAAPRLFYGIMSAHLFYSQALSQAEITQNTQYFKQQGWI